MMAEAQKRGASQMTLEVRETNTVAQSLYYSLDFENRDTANGTMKTRGKGPICSGTGILQSPWQKCLHSREICLKIACGARRRIRGGKE